MKPLVLADVMLFMFLLFVTPLCADPPKIMSLCDIHYPSDEGIEWKCRKLKRRDHPEKLFGKHWQDVLRFNRLDRHAAANGGPLVLVGDSGSGKSALMANWLEPVYSMPLSRNRLSMGRRPDTENVLPLLVTDETPSKITVPELFTSVDPELMDMFPPR